MFVYDSKQVKRYHLFIAKTQICVVTHTLAINTQMALIMLAYIEIYRYVRSCQYIAYLLVEVE